MTYNNGRAIGDFGEEAICDFLVRNGYEIIKRNFTIRGGEIDIIANKGDVIAFVEVKTRKPDALEDGESAITYKKKKLIIKTAEYYVDNFGKDNEIYRFDVAVVIAENKEIKNIKYYVGAFDASK